MTEMKARLVDKDGNPLGTAANPLKISGDVGGGVPDGGTTGQVLQKKTDADQDTEWGDVSVATTSWGSITGTLADQTDLNMALGGKVPTTRTVNSKALSDDISLTASDVGAATTADITYENLNTNGDVGTTSGTVCAGDDSRLSDSRTPTSHGNEAHSSIYLTEIDIHGEDSTDEFSTGDEVLIYDSSLGENRKILRGNFFNGLEGDYISIHGTFEETTPATNMELLVYDPSVPANRRMTRANFLDGISAVGAFTDLTDTPASYEGYDETYYVRVNAASNALEFATVPSSYTLPIASADTLGGVKIGDNLSIDGSGVLSAVASPYELPTASADTLGGVKVGSRLTITDGVLSADEQGGGLVKVSSNDTTAGYLLGKLVAGTNITLTEGSDGENETLTIASTGNSTTLVQRSLEGVVYETTLMYWRAPAACTINSVSMSLSSNPSATGSYCKVQVMKNGLLETDSIFTSDTPMQVTESTTASNGIYTASGTLDTGNDMDDLAEGDVVHFRVNQADTGSADLLVQMKVTFT